jgi:hypothetical protein
MKTIDLTNSPRKLLVDDELYPFLSRLTWSLSNGNYAQTNFCGLHICAQHMVMGSKKVIDHIDGNGLNNQLINLRFCTQSQNNANAFLNKSSDKFSSKFRGVTKQYNKYKASIMKDGRAYHLGTFNSETAAAKAYDRKAKEFFGEFARLNFPEEGSIQ